MPNHRRTLVRLAALAVLGAVAILAAACTSDDGAPATASPPPGTATATAIPTVTPAPTATTAPEPTPVPQPPATPGRFTIQLIDFDSPEAVGIRRDIGLITATADGVSCITVDADVLEPPAIILGAPDQPEECRRDGAWVALFSGDLELGGELWEHFRLQVGRAATLGNYATATPSEWPVTDGAGVFRHTGVLVVGFEIAALFGGNCPVGSSPTWISAPDDVPFFDMVVAASGAPAPDPFDVAMYRVSFFGEISPFGSYGHGGRYRYEIVPYGLEFAELARDCDWGAASEYRQARARWDAAATSDYRFTLQRSCECPDEWSAPTEVTVRAGLVASATLEDGTPAPDGAALTIEELFDAIASALNEPVESAVTYHAELGYPLDVQLDLEAIAVDGGLSLTVSDFERLD